MRELGMSRDEILEQIEKERAFFQNPKVRMS
jgi:hypothetical protein